jgi:Right handed beta helix region
VARGRKAAAALVAALAIAVPAGCGEGGGSTTAPPSTRSHAFPPGAQRSPAHCDRVSLRGGSAQRLADSLAPGQTGCLRNGTYANGVRIQTPDVTLTSFPGERATISGKLYITKDGDRVTVSDLNLVSGPGTGQFVNGTDDVFDGVDVTSNNTENCFIVGSADPYYGRTEGLVIENSRIHNCGQLNPDTNMDHGIYIAHADNTVIRDNWIYDNADRGIQLYPDSRGAHVYGNVIDGNGEGVTISGDGDTASSGNLVEHNVISNSKIRWNVTSRWRKDLIGSGNVVRENCLWASNSEDHFNDGGGIVSVAAARRGFRVAGNRLAEPQFADREAGDLTMTGPAVCVSLLSAG